MLAGDEIRSGITDWPGATTREIVPGRPCRDGTRTRWRPLEPGRPTIEEIPAAPAALGPSSGEVGVETVDESPRTGGAAT